MAKKTKNKKQTAEKIEQGKKYPIDEAAKLVKEVSFTKFDASIDMDFKLGVDPKKADQMVRGITTLPHGTGKEVKVLIAKKSKVDGQTWMSSLLCLPL